VGGAQLADAWACMGEETFLEEKLRLAKPEVEILD
jgi:hypothetical protein